jgi:hypothetical protein
MSKLTQILDALEISNLVTILNQSTVHTEDNYVLSLTGDTRIYQRVNLLVHLKKGLYSPELLQEEMVKFTKSLDIAPLEAPLESSEFQLPKDNYLYFGRLSYEETIIKEKVALITTQTTQDSILLNTQGFSNGNRTILKEADSNLNRRIDIIVFPSERVARYLVPLAPMQGDHQDILITENLTRIHMGKLLELKPLGRWKD